MTKPEARNPKQVRMTKSENAKVEKRPMVATPSRIGGSNLKIQSRRARVSACLAEVIQWIQSRRAMGVMSDHNARAFG